MREVYSESEEDDEGRLGTFRLEKEKEGRVGKRGGRHSIYTVGNPLWMCRINGMKACRACRSNFWDTNQVFLLGVSKMFELKFLPITGRPRKL